MKQEKIQKQKKDPKNFANQIVKKDNFNIIGIDFSSRDVALVVFNSQTYEVLKTQKLVFDKNADLTTKLLSFKLMIETYCGDFEVLNIQKIYFEINQSNSKMLGVLVKSGWYQLSAIPYLFGGMPIANKTWQSKLKIDYKASHKSTLHKKYSNQNFSKKNFNSNEELCQFLKCFKPTLKEKQQININCAKKFNFDTIDNDLAEAFLIAVAGNEIEKETKIKERGQNFNG